MKERAICATSPVKSRICTTVCIQSCWRQSHATPKSMPRFCVTSSRAARSTRGKSDLGEKGSPAMFRTLMVPLDGSELAERALPYAVRLAVASGARIALVRVALGPPPTGYDWERQQLDALSDAESYLREVADKVATRVPVRTLTPYGEASTQLLAVISE